MDKIQKQFKIGVIQATIWKNKGTDKTGKETEFNTVSLTKSYKDKNGEWQHTTSFKTDDLPKVILVLQKTYEHILLKDQDTKDNDTEIDM